MSTIKILIIFCIINTAYTFNFFLKNFSIRQMIELNSFTNTLLNTPMFDDESAIKEIIQFQNYHNYSIEYWHLGCLLIYIFYITFTKYMTNVKRPSPKMYTLFEYQNIQKHTKTFIFVFTFIFTKNIENAI